MRITYVLDTFGGGGKERRCLQIIQGLNRAGYNDIQVVIIDGEVAYKELYNAAVQVEIIDYKRRDISYYQIVREVRKHLMDFKSEVVQVWGIMSAGIVSFAGIGLHLKMVAAYVANSYSPKGLSALINAWCKLKCVKFVGNSKAGLKAYRIPKRKAVLIYNGFNEKRLGICFDAEAKKRELDIKTHYVVAMMATFIPHKDWKCFFDTAKKIVAERQDITFLAVGSGEQWNYYYEQINEEEKNLIRLLGRRNDVDDLYRLSDLTVLCSFGEGVSNSILESMAFGVPVIASDKGGTSEIIDDGVNGYLLAENNVTELKDYIYELLEDDKRRFSMAEKAKLRIKNDFLLSTVTAKYIRLYESIVKY